MDHFWIITRGRDEWEKEGVLAGCLVWKQGYSLIGFGWIVVPALIPQYSFVPLLIHWFESLGYCFVWFGGKFLLLPLYILLYHHL